MGFRRRKEERIEGLFALMLNMRLEIHDNFSEIMSD